ncbi:hypothetical protein [Limosilactobacillus sp.]|uniref:hypothetical protein n=1 Tax=Limosilactobacillus sp. TaxID=2773925 RepID=UPI0025BFD5FB|nr:hypothetical protein [Limosilactobacillus sp.]MCH3922913.1 hypothetical protein [Limosilactobacillus sp.]MCH3927596.1 hypothetical protein [Limosilactobacillus sp.]
MTKATTIEELLEQTELTVPAEQFVTDLLKAIERLRRRPLDVYYAGPRSLRVDGVTLMVDLQPKQAVIVHFNGQSTRVRVPL